MPKPKRNLVTAAFAVTAATVLVRFFGFLREVTLAGVYGAGPVSDAFILAFTIPNIVLMLIGSSLASSYIPLYTKTGDKKRFTDNVMTCLALVGLGFSVVFTFFPQALVYLFASQLDAETFALAANLLRVMVWVAVPVLLANILRSYLQIQNVFFVAVIVNIPINVMTIAAILASRPTGALLLMGVGVVAGHMVFVGLMFTAARKHGYTWRPFLNLRMPELREMLGLMAPVFLATAITDIHMIVNNNFASGLEPGSISALNFSFRVIGLITGLIGASAATVLFPRMSELSADGNHDRLKKYLSGYIKKLTPVFLPLTAGFVILAEPIIRILFERGSFTAEDTRRTAEALRMYALMCLPASVNPVLIRGFHAMRDTKRPAVLSAVAVGVAIALNFLLIGPLRHMGLALSTSIMTFILMGSLLLAMRKKLGPLGLRPGLLEIGKSALATAVMGAGVSFGHRVLPVLSGGLLQCIALTLGLTAGGAAVYFLLLWLLRSETLQDGIRQLRGLLKRK